MTKKKGKFLEIPETAEEMPVTEKQLKEVFKYADRKFESIDSKMNQFRLESSEKFDSLDHRVFRIEKKLERTEARLEAKIDVLNSQVTSRMNSLESKFEQFAHEVRSGRAEFLAYISEMKILAEQQENRNRIVLEGYATLRQEIERRVSPISS